MNRILDAPLNWCVKTQSAFVYYTLILALLAVMFLAIFIPLISLGWLVTVFPFWMLGMIDEVRAGRGSSTVLHVGLVLAYYTVTVPFTIWFWSDNGDDD